MAVTTRTTADVCWTYSGCGGLTVTMDVHKSKGSIESGLNMDMRAIVRAQ